ncbi:MAG: FAD-dependent oxidoreductase [Gordonia sp. (in: high G+C Gram-positive bacteria)]
MHRAVLVALGVLVLAAVVVSATDDEFVSRPEELVLTLLISMVVSYAGTAACAAVVRVPPGADSWAITGLILFFLMPGVTDAASAMSVGIAAAAAAASKYVIVWRRRLILNPAVAGGLVAYAVAYAGVSVGGVPLSSPTWWIAAEPLFWPMLVVGIVLVTVLREWLLVGAFLVATLVTVGVLEATTGGQDLTFVFVSAPTMFLAAVMLPEPLTSPNTRLHRIGYAVIVGVLANWQQTFEISSAYTLEFVPQIALGVGCLYAFAVWLIARRGAGRLRLAVTVDQIADGTYRVIGVGGAPVWFRPGQWALLSSPRWSAPVWGRSRRVFSYVSAPGGDQVEFGFTGAASAFKKDLVSGRTRHLYLDAVGGDFVLPRRVGQHPLVVIAGGIGITPFMAMIRSAGATDLSWLTVVQVIRAAERSVYADDLAAARAVGARVEVIVTPDGRVAPDALAGMVGAPGSTRYYLSGSPDFVSHTAAAIRSADPSTRIRFWRIQTDAFLGY